MDDNTVLSKIVKFIVGIIASVIAGIIVYIITTGNAPQLFLPPDQTANEETSIVDKVDTNTNSDNKTNDELTVPDNSDANVNYGNNVAPPVGQTPPSTNISQWPESTSPPVNSAPPNEPEDTSDEPENLPVQSPSNPDDTTTDIAIDLSYGFVLDNIYRRYNFEANEMETIWVADAEQVNINLTIAEPDVTGWQVTIGYPDSNFASLITDFYNGAVSFSCTPGYYLVEVFSEIGGDCYVYSAVMDFTKTAHHTYHFSDDELQIH